MFWATLMMDVWSYDFQHSQTKGSTFVVVRLNNNDISKFFDVIMFIIVFI